MFTVTQPSPSSILHFHHLKWSSTLCTITPVPSLSQARPRWPLIYFCMPKHLQILGLSCKWDQTTHCAQPSLSMFSGSFMLLYIPRLHSFLLSNIFQSMDFSNLPYAVMNVLQSLIYTFFKWTRAFIFLHCIFKNAVPALYGRLV